MLARLFLLACLMLSGSAALAAEGPPSGWPAERGWVEGDGLLLEPGRSATVRILGSKPTLAEPSVMTRDANRPAGDALSFRFTWNEAQGGTMLEVQNGYDRAIDIDAEIYAADGRHEPTSMCIVLPHTGSFEMWPFPIARIRVTRFQFVDLDKGGVVSCS